MHEIFIAGNTTYSAKTGGGVVSGIEEVDLLADGAIAFFDHDGTLIDAAAPVFTGNEVTIAMGRTTYGSRLITLRREDIMYNKQSYEAPVAQTCFIGDEDGTRNLRLNEPATLVEGTAAGVMINMGTNKKNGEKLRFLYQTTVRATDSDIGSVIDRIVTKCTNDLEKRVTLSKINTTTPYGIKAIGDEAGMSFSMRGWGILSGADWIEAAVAASTTAIINGETYSASTTVRLVTKLGNATSLCALPVVGSGYPNDISALEKQAFIDRGKGDSTNADTGWEIPTRVSSTGTYDKYFIKHKWPRPEDGHIKSDQLVYKQLWLVVPSSGYTTLNGNVADILAVI